MTETDRTFTEDVAPEPTPSAQLPGGAITPNVVGSNIDQAVEQTGMVALRVGFDRQQALEQEQAKQGHVAALGAATTLQTNDLQGLHGPKGLMQQNLGPNAGSAAEAFLTDRESQVAKLRDSLPTQQAQESFDLQEREHTLGVQRQLADWVDGQSKRYDTQVTTAKLQNSEDAAVVAAMNQSDPKARSAEINHQLTQGNMAIADYLGRQGITPATADGKAVIDQHVSEFNKRVLTRATTALIDGGDDQGAKALFDEHKLDLGDQSGPMSKLVEKAVFQGDTRRIAQQVALDPQGKPRSWDDIQDALAKNPKLQGNPDLRDAVTVAAAHLAVQQGTVDRQAQLGARNQALSLLSDPSNHWGIADPRLVALQDKMGGADSPAWRQVAAMNDRIQNHREHDPSDPAAFTELTRLAADPKRIDQFRAHDFQADYANGLINHTDFDHFTTAQADALKPDGGPKLAQLKAEHEDFEVGMRRAGLDALHAGGLFPDADKPSWLQKGALNDFEQQYQARLRVYAADPANAMKPLQPADRQKIVSDLLTDTVRTPGMLFSGVKPVSTLNADERLSAYEPIEELQRRDPKTADTIEYQLRSNLSRGGFDYDQLSDRDKGRLVAQSLILDEAQKRGDVVTARQTAARMNEIGQNATRRPVSAPTRRAGAAFVPGVGTVVPGTAAYLQAQRLGQIP